MAQMTQAQMNQAFLDNATLRNYAMSAQTVTAAGQVLDIQLDQVPGWASHIDLECYFDLAIALAAGGTAPSLSSFGPENIFKTVEVALGGGPFQRVNPFFYRLRQKSMNPGWDPSSGGDVSYSYAQNTTYSVAVSATAGSTTDNYWRFQIKIPLQAQHSKVIGLLPLGNASVTAKLRLTLQPNLYSSTDSYAAPLTGGTNVTSVSIGTAQTSWVQPNIWYRTSPIAGGALPNPQIGYVLNVQEQSTPLTTTGSLQKMQFANPFKYLRIWHVVVDGSGAANSSGVTNFEVDPAPGYPVINYANAQQLQNYFNMVRETYQQDLPTGVFVWDGWTGSNPKDPNGNQIIDGSFFTTLQTQLAVSSGTSVGNGVAKVVTYAECLSPVSF